MSFIPTKTSRNSHTKPWISSYIRHLIRTKQHVAQRSNFTLKWQAYKNIKKEVQQKCRSANQKNISSFCDKSDSVTKQLWSYIKQQHKDNCGVSSLKHNNVLYNDDTTKAQLLNDYFLLFLHLHLHHCFHLWMTCTHLTLLTYQLMYMVYLNKCKK